MKFYKKVNIPQTAREFGFFKRNRLGLDEIALLLSEGIEKGFDDIENGILETKPIPEVIQDIWDKHIKLIYNEKGQEAGLTSLVVKRKITECFAQFIAQHIQRNYIPD